MVWALGLPVELGTQKKPVQSVPQWAVQVTYPSSSSWDTWQSRGLSPWLLLRGRENPTWLLYINGQPFTRLRC